MNTTADDVKTGGGDFQPLDPRSVSHARVVGAIVTGVIGMVLMFAVLIVVLAVDDLGRGGRMLIPVLALLATAAIAWTAWKWPAIEHRRISFRVDDAGIEIRRGVWWRSVIHVPRSRIQHTDVSQGPIERNFDLSTLHVFTAGTENAEVTLGGLAHETAMKIRDFLLTGADEDVV